MNQLKYLLAYSASTREQVAQLIAQNKLAEILVKKYPTAHNITTDKVLFDYIMQLKSTHLRNAAPLNKAVFDSKIQIIQHALGLHTAIARVQGGKLKAKREIKIASLFKSVPIAFLNMIAVHELAHFKEHDHNKAFYQLCVSMQADYHQIEFDLRLYLTYLDMNKGQGKQALW